MTESNCKIQIENSSTDEAAITVGQIFELHCDGDWSQFPMTQANFNLVEADKNKIKLLDSKTTATDATFKVTSYVVGDHKLISLNLVSGPESRALNGVQFKVVSVIDPKEPPPEAFGPRGPIGLFLPWWYYAIIFVLVVGILGLIYRRWRRWQQKKKLIHELEVQGAAMAPFPQFSQSMRRLQRQFPFLSEVKEASAQEKMLMIEELEKSYRIYIGRTFLIPTFAWKDKAILRELKSTDRILYREQGSDVDRLLQEFFKAKEHKDLVKNQDLQQLLELARKNVDAIFTLLNSRKKS